MLSIPKPDKPAWAGPLDGGVTQSLLNRYLDCPFRFYLYAVLGKDDPTPEKDNLMWGSICHYGLEQIIKDPIPVKEWPSDRKDYLRQQIHEYVTSHFVHAPASFPDSCYEMVCLYDDSYKIGTKFETEKEFNFTYVTNTGNKVTLRGKRDGLSENTLVEHKCVGFNDPNQARLETPFDLQVNLYLMASKVYHVIYDKIRIPDIQKYAPPRRTGERNSNWVQRLYHQHFWKDFPISKNKFLWLDQFEFYRTEEEIEHWRLFELNPLLNSLCAYWEKVTDPNFDPNNPDHYDHLFYVKPIRTFDASRTEKYKCNYYDYLTGNMTYESLANTTFYAELTA